MLCREIFNPSIQNIFVIPVLNNQTHRWGYLLCNTGLFAVLKPLISPTYLQELEAIKTCDIHPSHEENNGFT